MINLQNDIEHVQSIRTLVQVVGQILKRKNFQGRLRTHVCVLSQSEVDFLQSKSIQTILISSQIRFLIDRLKITL